MRRLGLDYSEQIMSVDRKKDSSLVSIIIPMFNGENTILNCLESIKKQTYKHLEIIIVDDGSKDKSLEVCRNFIKLDNRFTLYSKNNGGVSSARNYALERVKGEFVTFIDCDDIVNVKYIEYLCSTIEFNSADICISSFSRVSLNDFFEKPLEIINQDKPLNEFNTVSMSPAEALESMIMTDVFKWEVCGKLFRVNVIDQLYFDETEILFEDFTYTCKALGLSSKIVYIPLKMYNYVDNPLSASKQKYSDKLTHLVKTTENFDTFIYTNFPMLDYCSKYFKVVIYFDILDKIICSSNSFSDCYNSYRTNRYSGKIYFELLLNLRGEIMKFDKIPKRIKVKYLFTINRLVYFLSRFSIHCIKDN